MATTSPQSELSAPSLSRSASDRLSLPLAIRLPLATTTGAMSGFILGLAKGSQDAGFRFRAENAHRLPETQTGWFLYHKSKNYNMMLGGVLEGFKQGLRYSLWVGLFFILEEGVDRGRAAAGRVTRELRDTRTRFAGEEVVVAGNRDCLSSTLAGLGTAGVFSAWNRFPLSTAARTARMGLKGGLAFGIAQDVLSLLRGRKVGYIAAIQRHVLGVRDDAQEKVVI